MVLCLTAAGGVADSRWLVVRAQQKVSLLWKQRRHLARVSGSRHWTRAHQHWDVDRGGARISDDD